jgi:drug/metabolite transporter (DMT)-like permease
VRTSGQRSRPGSSYFLPSTTSPCTSMIWCTIAAPGPTLPVPISLSSIYRDWQAGHGLDWRTETKHDYHGAVLALSSAFLFGASTPIAKLLLGITDPLLLAGLLYLGSGAGLALVATGGRSLGLGRSEAPLRARDLPWLGAIVLFGGILGPALLMWGLTLTSASTGTLLLNTEGLATMAIAWVVFRENVDRRIFLGAMAILAGAVVLSWPKAAATGPQLSWGSVLIVLACVAWGIDNNLTRKLSAADPLQIAMTKGLAAGAVNLALALAGGAPSPGLTTIAAAAAVGFFGYGVSLVFFVLGLRHLGAARTGAYFSTAPFIGAALALPLFGETPTLALIAAALLMGIGVYLHLADAHDHEHLHEPLEHEHRHVHDIHHQHEHAPEVPAGEPHSHWHRHPRVLHKHPHYPDLHHRHQHEHA